ncbi:MAG: recombinase family protein [Patescibacteria group bacterium]
MKSTEIEYTKAVIYCRVSSEKQVKEGNGLDSQEHRCREYAASLGLEVEKVFRDEGISGGLFDRPAMKSLIKYLDGHWQSKYFVIFDDLKRFARDVEVHIKLKSELKGRDAKLSCLNYNFDDSAEGEFVETIFAAQNELERKQNRRQVCQKMKARIERGYWCFYPPTGYEYRKDKEHGKILMPIKSITDILAEGLIAFAENRLLEQTDFLNYLKVKNFHLLLGKEARLINYEYIKGLLTQPLYAGIVEYTEWSISRRRGHHKAIITEEIYEKIQRKLIRPERKPRETDNLEFPLRRIITCSVCGMKMTGSSSKGKTKYYGHYTCNNKNCTANPKHISVDKLESDYIKLLENITVGQDVLDMAKFISTKIWEEKLEGSDNSKETKEAEKREIEQMIDDYVDLMPKTRLESIKNRYEAKIEELDKRLKGLEKESGDKKAPNFNEALGLTLKLLGTPAETWKNSNRDTKIMLHNMIFTENPTYSVKEGFGTPKLSLPFHIKELFCTKELCCGGPKRI